MDTNSSIVSSSASTSVNLNIPAYPKYQPPVPPKSHSLAQLQQQQKLNNPNIINNNHNSTNNNSKPPLRMFGDTLLKPTDDTKLSISKPHDTPAAQHDISLPQLKERRRQWRSMDNLHVQMGANPQGGHSNGGPYHQQPPVGGMHLMAMQQARLANFSYHMNSTENDQFWRYKAMHQGARPMNVLE